MPVPFSLPSQKAGARWGRGAASPRDSLHLTVAEPPVQASASLCSPAESRPSQLSPLLRNGNAGERPSLLAHNGGGAFTASLRGCGGQAPLQPPPPHPPRLFQASASVNRARGAPAGAQGRPIPSPLLRASGVPVAAVDQARVGGNSAHPPRTLSPPEIGSLEPRGFGGGGCPSLQCPERLGETRLAGQGESLEPPPSPGGDAGSSRGLAGSCTPPPILTLATASEEREGPHLPSLSPP